jgi:hypothetical protein
MSEIKDGGPAFPGECVRVTRQDDVVIRQEDIQWPGMSLRDWFAGQALAGYRAKNFNYDVGHDEQGTVAKWAYEDADAMLRAREGK